MPAVAVGTAKARVKHPSKKKKAEYMMTSSTVSREV